jgi:DNA polymerase type B, organellar and viral
MLTNEEELRLDRINLIKRFFLQFIDYKYHNFTLYAHNLSGFDGILILESLVYLSDDYGFKIEPLIRDNKIISIKVSFGKMKDNRYKYHITFHDSLLILLSSLENLSKSFLKDNPDMQKIKDKNLLDALLYKTLRKDIDKIEFLRELKMYCERDSISLALIIHLYSNIVYNEFKLNVHKYPTASALALAIYRSKFLESDGLIPLISGEIYKDIKKSYHGGHTEVYKLYSNEEVHSYDYVSMYPSQMLKHYMPVGKITKFEGNPLLCGETLESLSDKLAFIKCSVYVDKSLNRPVYQTIVKIKGELRSVCATGTFLNQWVYVPELLKYEEKTNGLIKIIPDSIKMGYLFDKKIIFKDFIEHLFNLRKSVSKDHPLNQICKINMNSLYGRMGLKQELTEYKFMNNFEVEKFSMKDNVRIKDVIEFSESLKSLVITFKNSDVINLKSSVPIASAITAYARMELNELILDQDLDILYVDTDSFKCHQKITELEKYKHLAHDNLGGLKYEETYSESLFLLPKVYGGIINDSEFTKVKGFKDKVEFNKLKDLLFKNKDLKLSHNKWRRNMLSSEIKIMKSPYNLSLNENKRLSDLKTLTTKPYYFD